MVHCQDKFNKIPLTIPILFICIFSGGCENSFVIEKTKESNVLDIPIYDSDDCIYGISDYPLLEVDFNKEAVWTVIIRNEYSNNEKVWISQDIDSLDKNKEYLRVTTFPIGRGTTPNGYVYVYKDDKLIKSVPYFQIEFGNEIIRNTFFKVETENIQKNFKLPPFI